MTDVALAVMVESSSNTLMIPYTYVDEYNIEDTDDFWFYSNLLQLEDNFSEMGIYSELHSGTSHGHPIDWFQG